jgi:hypothetical protein
MWVLLFTILLFSFLYLKLLNQDLSFVQKNFQNYYKVIPRANKLYNDIVRLNSKLLVGSSNFELSQYKFFTDLVYALLESAKLYGTGINQFLPEIKKALITDIRFERKIQKELGGGFFQMLIVQCFGLIFIYSFHTQMNKIFEYEQYSFVLFLSGLGFISYLIGFLCLKIKIFSLFEQYLKSIYRVRALLFARIPLSQVHKESMIESLPDDKDLAPLRERLIALLVNMKTTGELDKADLEMIIEEAWFVGEFKFENFIKYLSAFKLFIIVFFFLSGFMMILTESLESLAV